MTRTRLARLLWIVLEGPEIDDEADALLRAGAGGVVLFSRNITGADGLRTLTAKLRERSSGPLRVAIDHEGGHVARIGSPLTRFPSAMAIAATGSVELAEASARAAALELAWLGIDVNLAPVLDVAANPANPSVGVRSFGSDPGVVARFGAATVRGLRSGGVAATAKHFPGHGRTPVDTHHGLPTLSGGIDELRRTDLPPFQAAIEAGTELVMVSHAAYEGLTDGLPSTMSERIMTGLLRGELGFDGLILTDAMVMGAIADGHDIAAASASAVMAGAHAVMPLAAQVAALDALGSAHAGGRLSDERLANAVRRADELDRRVASRVAPSELPDGHAALAREIAQRSLTLCSSGRLLPVRDGTSVAVVDFASRRPSPIEEAEPVGGVVTLGAALRRAGLRVREVRLSGEADRSTTERAAAHEAAEGAEVVVLATRDAFLWPADRELVAELAGGQRPSLLLALRNPYDLRVLDWSGEAIAAYADVPATLEALAEAITGRAGFTGTLPMRLDAPAEAA